MRPTRIVVPEREKHDPVIQYENLDLSNGRNSFASGQSNDEFNKINKLGFDQSQQKQEPSLFKTAYQFGPHDIQSSQDKFLFSQIQGKNNDQGNSPFACSTEALTPSVTLQKKLGKISGDL